LRGGGSVSLPLPWWVEKEPYGGFFGDPLSVPNGASEMPSTSRLERGEKMLREVCRELSWRTEDFLGEWGGEVFRRLRRKLVWRAMVPVSSV